MTRYVAFLRAMNTGRRRARSGTLCASFERLGLEDVSAFLASGNVMFETARRGVARLRQAIERGLESDLGYEVPTFLRTSREVAAIAAHEPFDAATTSATQGKLQVMFLASVPSAAQRRRALALRPEADALAFGAQELFWLPRAGVGSSELPVKTLESVLGPLTTRTHRTLVRLAARLDAGRAP